LSFHCTGFAGGGRSLPLSLLPSFFALLLGGAAPGGSSSVPGGSLAAAFAASLSTAAQPLPAALSSAARLLLGSWSTPTSSAAEHTEPRSSSGCEESGTIARLHALS
jgi:hypothetical protein